MQGSKGDFDGIVMYPTCTSDTDGDGIVNQFDLDSDNDGIADNIEAQNTFGYIAPTGLDTDGDGLDNAYEGAAGNAGLTPYNFDGDAQSQIIWTLQTPDNDGASDTAEAGITLSGKWTRTATALTTRSDTNDALFGIVNPKPDGSGCDCFREPRFDKLPDRKERPVRLADLGWRAGLLDCRCAGATEKLGIR